MALTLMTLTLMTGFRESEMIMTGNDRDRNDRILWGLKMIMTLNDFDPS